jgi:hypothetical protein
MNTERHDPLRVHRLLIDACLSHGVPFFWRGPGTLLISGAGLRPVLEDVKSSGETVIGLEGFEFESTVIHPRLDLIYDASVAPQGGAVSVGAGWGPAVWIDVTLVPAPRGAR